MRKVLIIIVIASLIYIPGCTKINNTLLNTYKQNNSVQVDLTTNKTDTTNNAISVETIDNSFFFKDNISQINYEGDFLFNDIVKKKVKMNINKVINLKYGILYELKLDSIEGVPNERLSLGYFYVQKDKIYKIEPTEENLSKLKTSEELPNASVIVCQDKELKDTLNKDELGWHHYLEVVGDKREYHSYNNKISTGYFESFTWEKGKGLTKYRSGYGADRDLIELQLKEK